MCFTTKQFFTLNNIFGLNGKKVQTHTRNTTVCTGILICDDYPFISAEEVVHEEVLWFLGVRVPESAE